MERNIERYYVAVLMLATSLALGGCKRSGKKGSRQVVVYTSVDQVFSEPVLRSFEKKEGIKVRAVFDTEETKSTGVLNRLIAEAQNPRADLFWSGDPVRPFSLIKRGLVEHYVAPNAAGIPSTFRAKDGTWSGFAARARVLLVNKRLVAQEKPPRSIQDLAAPRWKSRAAIANPLFGTTTMHVAALFSQLRQHWRSRQWGAVGLVAVTLGGLPGHWEAGTLTRTLYGAGAARVPSSV